MGLFGTHLEPLECRMILNPCFYEISEIPRICSISSCWRRLSLDKVLAIRSLAKPWQCKNPQQENAAALLTYPTASYVYIVFKYVYILGICEPAEVSKNYRRCGLSAHNAFLVFFRTLRGFQSLPQILTMHDFLWKGSGPQSASSRPAQECRRKG